MRAESYEQRLEAGLPAALPPCRLAALHAALILELATPADAPAIAALGAAVARELTCRFGTGHWSSEGSERGVLNNLRTASIYIAKKHDGVIASFQLATKKPWAIDPKYFTPCERPLYLTSMAVAPAMQRQGIGRLCLEEAKQIVKLWPAGAIRLDCYDADAGASKFYRKCGLAEVGRVSFPVTPLIYFEQMISP
ncbi:MAG: GNAT family N-acetyltransferase [Gemmatimonadota bacterium]